MDNEHYLKNREKLDQAIPNFDEDLSFMSRQCLRWVIITKGFKGNANPYDLDAQEDIYTNGMGNIYVWNTESESIQVKSYLDHPVTHLKLVGSFIFIMNIHELEIFDLELKLIVKHRFSRRKPRQLSEKSRLRVVKSENVEDAYLVLFNDNKGSYINMLLCSSKIFFANTKYRLIKMTGSKIMKNQRLYICGKDIYDVKHNMALCVYEYQNSIRFDFYFNQDYIWHLLESRIHENCDVVPGDINIVENDDSVLLKYKVMRNGQISEEYIKVNIPKELIDSRKDFIEQIN